MFTIITNHYLPEITCTISLSQFSQNDNFKTWREHTEKSSIENALKLAHILSKRLCTR